MDMNPKNDGLCWFVVWSHAMEKWTVPPQFTNVSYSGGRAMEAFKYPPVHFQWAVVVVKVSQIPVPVHVFLKVQAAFL